MLVIGLIFIGAVLAVGMDVWQENNAHVVAQGFGHTFSQPPWVVLVAGAACGALLVVGVALLAGANARRRRLYHEHLEVLRDVDRLAKEIDADRAACEGARTTDVPQVFGSRHNQALAPSTEPVAAESRTAPSIH
jgi:hypothetical protein